MELNDAKKKLLHKLDLVCNYVCYEFYSCHNNILITIDRFGKQRRKGRYSKNAIEEFS